MTFNGKSLILTILILLVSSVLVGQAPRSAALSNADFQKQLDTTISVHWNLPLSNIIKSIRETQNVAVFLDRRIDPQQTIQLKIQDTKLTSAFDQLAAQCNSRISIVRNVVYIGPVKTTQWLATLAEIQAENHRRRPGPETTRLFQPQTTQWSRLSQPRIIVEQVAESIRAQVTNLEVIPFDLWDQNRLPALPFAHRFTLLLAGFNLTYQVNDDHSITLVTFPEQAKIQKTFLKPVATANLARIKTSFPMLEILENTNQLVVRGRWEDIEQLDQLLRGKTVTIPDNGTTSMQVYTLTVTNQTIQDVLKAIAANEKLELTVTAAAMQRWGKRITLTAKELPLTELLKQVVQQGQLQFKVDDKQLQITVARP